MSGFAGMLTMLLSWYIAALLPLCGFMAGLAGLMGSKALELYERRATGWMGGKGVMVKMRWVDEARRHIGLTGD